MGLFYAYFYDTQSHSNYCKYLFTFADRETADEWWRTISPNYRGIIKRTSPQLYFRYRSEDDNSAFYKPGGSECNGKTFYIAGYTRNEKLPIVCPITLTDHISGRWYFIRSKEEPSSRWYLRTRGNCSVCGNAECAAIHVSSEYRTKFCVRVRNPPKDVGADFVMIGKDEISIEGPKGFVLHTDDTGDLKATREHQGETDFVFSDLKHRFIARAEKQVNGEVWEYVESVERGSGEAWEVVD